MPRGWVFFSQFQTHHETSELWNSSECSQKFSEIFGNSQFIFGNSGTPQGKNLTALTQKKLAVIQKPVDFLAEFNG